MTSLDFVRVTCQCGHSFTTTYPRSICTWLNPDHVKQFLEGTLFSASCEECGKNYKISAQVLMNTPRGLCYLSSDADPDEIKDFLVSHEVINEYGDVYSPDEIIKRLQYNKEHGLHHSPDFTLPDD